MFSVMVVIIMIIKRCYILGGNFYLHLVLLLELVPYSYSYS